MRESKMPGMMPKRGTGKEVDEMNMPHGSRGSAMNSYYQ
jgi:hypothetical protein